MAPTPERLFDLVSETGWCINDRGPRPPASVSAPTVEDAAVFAALGDATRLDLLHRRGTGGATTATVLADPLPVTRQAVSRHLRVLQDAGLARTHKAGRDVLYAVDPAVVAARAVWLHGQARAWR